MKKGVLILSFLIVFLMIPGIVSSANCTFQRLYWGPGTAVENTDVIINTQVQGDTCQGKVISFSVKEYDHGLTDDSVTTEPASVTIGSNSPPDGSWVYRGATWRTEWQEDTDHPGETNPPEYYLIGTLDGQTFSSRDPLNVYFPQLLNVTKYVAPPPNNTAQNSSGNFSNNNTNLSAIQQQVSVKLNETQARIDTLKNQTKAYPQFYQQRIEEIIQFTSIESQYSAIKRDYDAGKYENITKDLEKLDVPSVITTTQTAKSIVFLPKRENMDISTLAGITGENYSSSKESQYKEAILAWNLENLDTKIDFNEISIVKNNSEIPILRFFKLNVQEKQGFSNDSYLIISNLENLKFNGNYGRQQAGSYYYINLNQENKEIEFSTTGNASFSNLPLFISPRISELGVSDINLNDGKSKISKWWIFAIIIAVLFIIWMIVYAILHKWYKNEYEFYLFKNRTNLYNILTYINNSRKAGIKDGDISHNLKLAGWNGEQITYAMKTYVGKKIGMFDFWGLFKGNKNQTSPPKPQGLLPQRDRNYIQRRP
ncbi:hypothetical protein HY212_02575 [Candidatus Pacearchaeota archaeon]|nr:hypothetical protein [Candidatus Pacearchaeota archaeon]